MEARKPAAPGEEPRVVGQPLALPQAGAARVLPAETPALSRLLALALTVVIVSALYFARDVLVPVTLAILLSFVLSPVVALLRKARFKKAPAVILAVVLALGLLGSVGTVVGNQAASLSADAPRYARTIQEKLDDIEAFALARAAFLTQKPRSAARPATSAAGRETTGVSAVTVQVAEPETSPLKVAWSIIGPIVAPLETFFIVVVVAIFILLQKEDLRDRFIRMFGSTDLHRTTLAIDDAATRLSRYFLSQLAVNTAFGLVVGIGLWLIGLPVPALWGFTAGLLRFVPYIGALLGAALPFALAAAVDPGWTMAIYVAILFLVVEPLVGYVVEPFLYGHSTGLSPVSVVVAAVFWTWIWGPVGLILSMPLTLCLVVLGRHVRSLEFLDVMLGDRPALTPVESFYQRILADDPAEALEQAEELLKVRPLVTYYDEIALKGLKLAAEDWRRGVIDRPKAERMVIAMTGVIEDLADHADRAASMGSEQTGLSPVADEGVQLPESDVPTNTRVPDAWQNEGAITCVAGRGPLDDAVTAMLAQLLERDGFGTRRVKHGEVTRHAIINLDLSAARLICVSYLEIGGTPAHLRFLVRRLRTAAPAAKVLVGLWPEGDLVHSDEEVRRLIGADLYASSLRQVIEESQKESANS